MSARRIGAVRKFTAPLAGMNICDRLREDPPVTRQVLGRVLTLSIQMRCWCAGYLGACQHCLDIVRINVLDSHHHRVRGAGFVSWSRPFPEDDSPSTERELDPMTADGFPLMAGYRGRPVFRVIRLRFDHYPTTGPLAPPAQAGGSAAP